MYRDIRFRSPRHWQAQRVVTWAALDLSLNSPSPLNLLSTELVSTGTSIGCAGFSGFAATEATIGTALFSGEAARSHWLRGSERQNHAGSGSNYL